MYHSKQIQLRTLSKEFEFDNMLIALTLFLAAILSNLYASVAISEEISSKIPITITWWNLESSPLDTGSQKVVSKRGAKQPKKQPMKTGYRLEVSNDEKFGTILLKTDVTASQYSYDAPKEGVYHWRVTPLSRIAEALQNGQQAESSSFASGSFIALEPMGSGTDPVHIKWAPIPGIEIYHVRLQSQGKFTSVLMSMKPEYYLPRQSTSIGVQIVPHNKSNTGTMAPDALTRFDPSLVILSDVTTKSATGQGSRELLVGDQSAPDETKRTIEALPPAPAAIELLSSNRDEVVENFSDERVSEVILAGSGGVENISAAKGSDFVRSAKGTTNGILGKIRIIPLTPLHLMARVDAHARLAKWRDINSQQIAEQPITTAFGNAGIGFDTFFRNPNRRHQLVLELKGMMGRVPMIPYVDQNLNLDVSLKLKNMDLQMIGVGLWYRWTLGRWGLSLEGAQYRQSTDRSEKNDTTLNEWSGHLAIDPAKYVTIQLGGGSRYLTATRCNANAVRCDAEGSSKVKLSQSSGFLGIGYVVR